jgi:hypothetical protein
MNFELFAGFFPNIINLRGTLLESSIDVELHWNRGQFDNLLDKVFKEWIEIWKSEEVAEDIDRFLEDQEISNYLLEMRGIVHDAVEKMWGSPLTNIR